MKVLIIIFLQLLFSNILYLYPQNLLEFTNSKESDKLIELKIKDLKKQKKEQEEDSNEEMDEESLLKIFKDLKINEIEKEIKKLENEKNTESKPNLNLLGSLVTSMKHFSVQPVISLSGTYKLEKNKLIELKLITGAPEKDTSMVNSASNLFLSEKSLYSISLNGLIAVSEIFGLNGSVIFAGKNISNYDTTKSLRENEDLSLLNIKGGMEFAVVPKKISIYLNYNYCMIATNVAKFKSFYGEEKKDQFGFLEMGFKGFVKLVDDNSQDVFIDVKFVYADDKVREITQGKDKIIAQITLGYSGNIIGK